MPENFFFKNILINNNYNYLYKHIKLGSCDEGYFNVSIERFLEQAAHGVY